jgi:hypothetical protein
MSEGHVLATGVFPLPDTASPAARPTFTPNVPRPSEVPAPRPMSRSQDVKSPRYFQARRRPDWADRGTVTRRAWGEVGEPPPEADGAFAPPTLPHHV